jgi:outer membrane translocation and assembly module TamA
MYLTKVKDMVIRRIDKKYLVQVNYEQSGNPYDTERIEKIFDDLGQLNTFMSWQFEDHERFVNELVGKALNKGRT